MKIKKTILFALFLSVICTLSSCGQLLDSPDDSVENDSKEGKDNNSKEYNIIYDKYINSNEWKKVKQENKTYDIDSVEIDFYKIYDFNNDGIPEFWYIARESDYDVEGGIELSGFCTIVDNNVKVLLTGYRSGGTIGGDSIKMYFDEETSHHVIGLTGYASGFGGKTSWAEYYTLKDASLNQLTHLSQISQMEDEYEDSELKDPSLYYVEKEAPFESSDAQSYITIYKVNNKQVTKEDFNKVKSRFVKPKDKNFIMK